MLPWVVGDKNSVIEIAKAIVIVKILYVDAVSSKNAKHVKGNQNVNGQDGRTQNHAVLHAEVE